MKSLNDAVAVFDRRLALANESNNGRPGSLLGLMELEVLQWLQFQPDKEIARKLKLTNDGVRYSIRFIFPKPAALGRCDRALSAGVGFAALSSRTNCTN